MRLIIPYSMDLSAPSACTANGVAIAEPDLTGGGVGDPAAYNAVSTYTKADRVHSPATKRIYHSVRAANSGNPLPERPEYRTTWWEDIGAINRYACTDDVLANRTRGAGPIVITVAAPNADTVAALNVQASGVLYELLVAGNVVWSNAQDTNDLGHITDAYQYYFSPVRIRTDALAIGIPPYYGAQLRATFSPAEPGGLVGLGRLVVGRSVDLGRDEYGIEPGIVSWSTADLSSTTGITHLSQGGRSRRLRTSCVLRRGELDAVMQAGEDAQDKYCLWSIDAGVKSLNVFARHTRFEPRIVSSEEVLLQINLEGAV